MWPEKINFVSGDQGIYSDNQYFRILGKHSVNSRYSNRDSQIYVSLFYFFILFAYCIVYFIYIFF